MTATILTDRDTCYACAVRCKRVVETEWQGRPVEPRHGGPEYETARRLRVVLRRRRPSRDLAGQQDLQRARPGHDRHGGHRRLGDGMLRARPADRGRPRLPGALRRRRGDGPPDRDDRPARGVRRRPGERLAARRRPDREGPRPPDHRQGCRGARPHAAGEAVARRDLRGQPVRRGPPVVRARPDDRGGRRGPLPGPAQAARVRRGARVRLARPGQGPLRPADPAVLLVPRHGLAVPVRVGPGVDPVRAAGDRRLRAGRHRLGATSTSTSSWRSASGA